MKILVVAPSWIGDCVLAQPLFTLLRRRTPSPDIDVIAPGWTLPVFERMPEIRRAMLHPFAHGHLRIGDRYRLGRSLAPEHYDAAIVLPNTFKSALLPLFAGIPLRTGYRGEARGLLLNDVRTFDAEVMPQLAQRYAALALPDGAPLTDPLPLASLSSPQAAREAVVKKLGLGARPAIAFCPGAEYGPAKRWPARHFAAIARSCAEQGVDVWLIGSPKDAATGDEIVALAPGAAVNLCGRTSLAEAIDLLAAARLVVSNESGLMHVAAGLARPLIALYGSSSPRYTPPMSPEARILTLGVECSPCFSRECPLGHFRCLNDLVPGQVLQLIDFAGILRSSDSPA